MRNRRVRTSTAGFTLIELLVYIGVSTAFIAVITEVLVASVNVKLDAQSFSYLESDYRFLTLKLSDDLSRAQTITAPANIGSPSSTLSITISSQPNTYSLADGALVVTNNYGQTKLTSSETTVTDFSVTRYGPAGNYVAISATLQSKTLVNGQAKTKVLNFTTGLP